MALRELVIAVGFQIDSHPLVQANEATDSLKSNLLGAGDDALQLGANIEAAGAIASASMDTAALSTSELGATALQAGADASAGLGAATRESEQFGASVDAIQGPFSRLRQVGSEALDTLKAKYDEHKEKLEEIGKTLEKNRVLIGGVFAATGGFVGVSVKRAADFEQAMSGVGALVRATDEEMKILSDTARELGATTVFSASEAAEGMSYLAMRGFEVNQIVAAMPGLLNAAAATQTSLGMTADVVSGILEGFRLEAEETARVADIIAAATTSSSATIESLGQTMSYVAPVAVGFGADLEEVTAITGRLADMQITGTRAGTALRAIYSRLAAPTGEAEKLLQKLGVTVQDSSGNMLSMIDIIRQIEVATKDMGTAERAATLQTLVGMEAVSAFSALLDIGADNLASYADELRNSAGMSALMAERRLDNLHGALTQLRSAFEEMQIAIGNAFIPVLRLGARVLTGVVNVFNKLPGPIKTVVAVGLGFVAMLTGAALAASFIIPQLSNLGSLLQLTRTGFAAVTKVIPFMTANIAKLGTTLNLSFWPVTATIVGIVAAILILQDVFTYLRGQGDSLTGRVVAWGKEWISGLAQPIVLGFTRVQDFVGRVVTGIRNLGGIVADMPSRIATWFIGGFQAGLQWLLGLPGRTIELLGTWLNSIRDWFASTFNLGDVIAAGIERAMEWIPAPLRGIAERILSFLPQSPAEEGPLAHLDRVGPGLVGTIADSIAGTDINPITSAMERMLGQIPLSADGEGGAAMTTTSHQPWMGTLGGPTVHITVNVDASNSRAEDAERIGEVTADRIRQVIEEFVRMDYYAVALEGI